MKKIDSYLEIIAVKLGILLPYKDIELKLTELPKNERERILRFHKLEDQQRTLLAHLCIRKRLQRLLLIPADTISIKRDRTGRPFLNKYHGWKGDFNLSHSEEWIICGLASTGRIGVDIEKIQPIDLSVTELCFTQEEIDYFQYIPHDRQLSFFFDIWTLKESFVKAIGKGLLYPLDSFGFNMDDWSQNKITLRNTNSDFSQFYFCLNRLEQNYTIAVCYTDWEQINNSSIKILDCSEFL
ncbi:4'-phosphopantetheinyl transferase superfamily protein [Bacillus mycoides]|uniref:4-phosphopantetheinyl transferase n=1 Tax=Bacillus mycoides TaxID=1405 RepID=A0A1S9T4S7_BACMY|nr:MULTISPECIES: 4'-phosphopantetheinyl transferase superfamily protein [Bacillus]EJS12877.1 phosphopantetheine-protein transferase domain protein [Bacillus cereus VDM062]MBJ7957441.1 4'-phosphopantetheinyl transferase superfamily protein [Bacillus cereus group sp. N28]OOR05026.1 4-phosphopantetheinyl transferase [Bacillus mycoides]PRD08717.1 4-phosphopantetheinyl transferase [Bacillus sp. MYb56]RAN73757.1 4-phosphopantetheinyl transferase [Bacillus sp. SRB_8]